MLLKLDETVIVKVSGSEETPCLDGCLEAFVDQVSIECFGS
jgi:hypothetical protein